MGTIKGKQHPPQASQRASNLAAAPTREEPATDVHANDARLQQIAEVAYRLAEQRGFQPGREVDDWLEAERIIDGGQPS